MQNNKNILNRFPRWLVILFAVIGCMLVVTSLFVGATIVAMPIMIRHRLRQKPLVQTKWELPERRKTGPNPASLNQAWPF